MKDRLQFRHHDAIFNTREDAINYITNDIRFSENGLSNDDVKQRFSLYGEPTVLRYKNADDESNPHIILAIGSKSNQVEGAQFKDNKFCFIDIDKTEDEIEALGDKLKNAITSLEIFTRDTSTLSLSVDKNESGETLSGNVKVPATYIINGTVTNNTLKVTENGIFTYVNLNYDKDTDKLTFTVNGDTKEWNVNNDYITGGTYSIKDESLHLNMHSGKDIKIPFEDLINEWDVEGENANSPIVLTREKVLYEDDKVVDHRHGNRWQDTLKADVRIAKIPHNILNRTEDGKALYVEGTAGNIKFFKDGKEMTVADALVECAQKKLSTDNDNMIYERPDGFFAMSRLTYDAKENTLTFTTSNQSGGTTTENIELNSIKIIDDARYDRDTESLIFIYTTAKGEYKKLVVPVGSLIDEWVVNNDGHNVILNKERKSNVDKDILSADVRVSSLDNNILVEKGDGLYVNGEAKNIKYSDDSSVKDEISAAKESIANEIERAKKAEKEASDAISNVVATIGSGFTTDTHETVTCKVGQLDNAIKSKVSSVGKIDNSVVVDASDANNPKVGVKLSSDKRDEKIPNLIEVHENGLFAAVDLSYDESGNSLTFTTTNGSKTINLAMNSFVDNIYYDASREVIVIEYTVNGKKMPNVEVPVRTLINEWTVSDNTDGAVKLKKTVNNSGASDNNKDILSAEVIIDKNHGDNMLINDNGALYVSSGIVKEVASKLDKEIERATKKDESLENKIDEATLGFSSTTSVNVDANDKKNIKLSTKISNSNNNLITIDSVKEGLYVTASVNYDNAKNELQLLDTNQNVISHTKLGSGSIIESITYDKNGKNLVITYKNSDGEKFEINVPVEDLFNEWTVDNKSEGSALELKKVVFENGSDLLSGKVLLATGETDNMIQIVGNGLYVSSSDIKQNTANIAEVTEKVNTLKTDFDAEKTRSTAKDAEQDRNIETLSGKSASSDAAIDKNTQAINVINTDIAALKQKDIDLSNGLNAEVTRASNAEDNLNKAISAETKARKDAESEIKAGIQANKLQFADSTSVSLLRSDATSPNTVKGSVKISNSNNNLITIDSVKEGLYVTASVNYDNAKNELQLLDTNQNVISHTKLGSGSIIESITYDKNGKNLVITYKNSDGEKFEINVPVEDLFNEWTVDNKSEGSALELKKVVFENGSDLLSGKVLLATGETDNMIQIVGNGLYVSSSDIKQNTANIAEVTEKVNTLKTDFDAEKTRSTAKDAEQDRNIETLSGKSASSDAAIDKNTQAINVINTDIAALKQKDIDLSNGLNAEVTRASNAEDNLNKAISAETKAREDAESEIKADIETNRNAIDAASKSIASETNRATSAETALKTSIEGLKHSLDDTNASLTNEVAKITAVTSTLATNLENEVTRSSNEDRRLSDSLTTEANRAQSAETSISNSLTAEVTRATNIENAIKSDLVKEVSDRKSSDEGFKEDIKKINSGNTAISGAVTSLESKINSEIQRSKDADNSHSEKIKANTDLVNSTKNALDAEVTRATNAELTNKDALTAEITRAKAEEASISNSLAAEVTRASKAEDDLNKAITAETKAREDAEKVIKADIEANKLQFADSTSVSLLRSDATSPNTVKASVKISNAPKNLLSLSDTAEGLFANVSLSYNAATNTLSVIGSDGHSSISDVKLGVGSIVDSITYDSAEKALVITYTDSTGSQHSTKANVEDLFNEWEPDSDANNVAIELIKHNNGIKNDVLTAKVRVSAEDDNIIKIKDNMLYASNAPIVKNATDITALSGDVKTITANVTTLSGDSKNNLNELRNLEKATLGLISPVGDVKYTPHEDAHLISAATSMNSADVILDNKLFEVSGKVTTVEATLDLNSKELKKVEKVIGVTGNGDNDIAYPNNGHGIIDGAATYADADEKLEKALVDVKTLTSGALTPTANLHVDGVDSDKKLQVDVRLSHGKGSTMTDENLTITSTDSPEFSEENALRKVALDNGDVTSTMSGLFLSTTWNCGEYDRDERPESMDIFNRLFDNSKRQ